MKTKLLKILPVFAAALLLLSQANIGFAQEQAPPAQTEGAPAGEVAAGADTTAPSDVENVKAEPGDKEITLSWDVATDNVGVVGYKIYYGTKSVTEQGQAYESGPIVTEDVVTHTITELENDKAYYFAVTAVDAAKNESESWSVEVNATPQAGLKKAAIEDDGKNPEVKSAEAKATDEVKVTFSEPIVLPLENPESAFVIKTKKDDKVELKVKRAELDPEDEEGKAVILLTDAQKSEEEYELTVGVEIKDHYDNAVVKDTGDKAAFTSLKIAEAKPEDKTPPEVSEVKIDENKKVTVTFSEEVTLAEDPKTNFSIVKKDGDPEKDALKILNVSLSTDGKTAYLSTDPQEDVEYEVKFTGLKDAAGNEMAEATKTFQGKSSSLKDLIPPEDVTELLAKLAEGKTNVVELQWKKSKNTAGDLAQQLLYQSSDKGKTYGKGKALGKDVETTEVKGLRAGREYTFKVTSKDTSGNESKGTIVAIVLPQTGPALPFILGLSLAVGYFARKKKSTAAPK